MKKWMIVGCAAAIGFLGAPRQAAADWLLSGFVGPITNVKTSELSEFGLPAEEFDSSVGFGINLASAFATRSNVGFELDFGVYNSGLETSSIFATDYASQLMSISTNFFYSPALAPVRPYFTVGPTFSYRRDKDTALFAAPSGWAVGMNVGGGVMAFLNERFAGRVDVRYFRNFGDFYDLSEIGEDPNTGYNNLQFIRFFFGATVVL